MLIYPDKRVKLNDDCFADKTSTTWTAFMMPQVFVGGLQPRRGLTKIIKRNSSQENRDNRNMAPDNWSKIHRKIMATSS